MIDAFDPEAPPLKVIKHFQPIGKYWTLHGGGALAYHLRHRELDEVDIFREITQWTAATVREAIEITIPTILPKNVSWVKPLMWEELRQAIMSGKGSYKIRYPKFTISVVIGPKAFGSLSREGGDQHLPVASLIDCVGGKFFAVLGREEAKDYRDLAAVIAHGWNGVQIADAAKQVAKFHIAKLNLSAGLNLLINPPPTIAEQLSEKERGLLKQAGQAGLDSLQA